jgi:hypothetical protein
VIVWINGPFGVGKTTVATRLRAAILNARIFDPEDIGWIIGRLPGQGHRDYQNRLLWRWITRELARGRTLIVPMTICEPRYFDEIVGRLRTVSPDLGNRIVFAVHIRIDGRAADEVADEIRRRIADRLVA